LADTGGDGAVPVTPHLRIRILFGDRGMIGPGKAELLERIAATGSIAAAGRDMGMSYKRAWMLVETLNAMFREPLVTSTRGGPGGGGAALTQAGQAALAAYRAVEDTATRTASAPMETLRAMLRDIPAGK
jgi:molybdate transport system regulatory protein